ncbi:hypothetical protein PVAND_002519 [Polypedilum vanderplanki]|uniref:DnaJ homolog subfamily C member 16 n=1 Tax=Polypedilum vanderplanki TaxID=319348 RepID=A0A9J6BR93_POLVA|nr:hypothetical protein PVAND_002519 [Polypedilum vanderplanki]
MKLNLLLVFLCLTFILECSSLEDPYKILGVDRKASLQEIKKAYKQLAKSWHPDKNPDNSEAEKKFIEIKSAYELLSDPERRKAFDLHGITNENYPRERFDYSKYGRFEDPFDNFFGHNNFFQNQDISFFHKLSITSKYYETTILPKSKRQPIILIFYSDWCFACVHTAPTFKKMIDSFESVGVIFATVNAAHEYQLVRKTSIHSLPSILMILDEHTYMYKEGSFSLQKIADFIRQKLPYKLILPINDGSLDSFLNGWHDNRVRGIFFEARQQPRLRYLLTAFLFKNNVHFGFVQTLKPESKEIIERYKINPHMDTLLLFNEDSQRPIASVSMSDISLDTLNNIIKGNQYLALPRLSSQSMMDGICPKDSHHTRKKLCVILITENSRNHDYARQVLRRIAIESSSYNERVKFAYMYKEKQSDFIHALSIHHEADKALKIVVIWRKDSHHVKYEWIADATLEETSSVEIDEENYNQTKRKIEDRIQKLLKANEGFAYEAEVLDLFDEHSQGLASRVIKRIIISIDYLYDSLGHEHLFPAASVIGTILFILGIGYLMSYLVKIEEANVKKQYMSRGDGSNDKLFIPELKIHELRAEKYNGLVRLLKPGCRTIVLIADQQSRPKLLPGFHKAIWPYRRNKTLMFSIMLTERGLHWYSELLRLSLMHNDDNRDLKINPRNCIGTVLALNGHRKYFCMYHAKHPETSRGNRRMLQMTKTLSYEYDDLETGAFLGFDDSEDLSDQNDVNDSKILLEENLLDGLSNWLDRLFEGSTHRYFINYWPDWPLK